LIKPLIAARIFTEDPDGNAVVKLSVNGAEFWLSDCLLTAQALKRLVVAQYE